MKLEEIRTYQLAMKLVKCEIRIPKSETNLNVK